MKLVNTHLSPQDELNHETRNPLSQLQGMCDVLLDTPLQPQQREYVESIRTSVEVLHESIHTVIDGLGIESAARHLRAELGAKDAAKVLQGFLTDMPERISALRTLVAGDDSLALARAAHQLAERAAFFGMAKFKTHALELATCAEAGSREQFAPTVLALEARFDLLKPWLGNQLADCLKPDQLFKAPVSSVAGLRHRDTEETPFIREPSAAPAKLPPHFRILIAEDHDINRRLTVLTVEKLGCRPDFVCNGQEAVDAWERFPYDVILMDCQMPILDGDEATREIRRREAALPPEARRHVQIVAMASNAMHSDREKWLAAGMDGYISKPVRLEALHAALTRAMKAIPVPAPPSVFEAAERSLATLRTDFGSEAAAELLHSFLTDMPPRLAELPRLAAGSDQVTFARAAFLLASSSRLYGLNALCEKALQLESHAKAGALSEYAPAIAALEAQFQTLKPWLEARLAEFLKDGAPPEKPI